MGLCAPGRVPTWRILRDEVVHEFRASPLRYRDAGMEQLSIVERFAQALDEDDFDTARSFVAEDCTYLQGEDELIGPDAIIASYQGNSEWARENLDELRYESSVRDLGDGLFEVHYADHSYHKQQRHTFRCAQRIALNAEGKIARIIHFELPGQREALNDFFTRVGIERRTT